MSISLSQLWRDTVEMWVSLIIIRILPLGASFPEMTVLKYGGYFPPGTSFPGGILTPVHARMVNLLPQESKKSQDTSEGSCLIQ
ncbi:hypothetical protein BCR39DRAFT_525347 [Naematelia encephala]|uniref:Uncharacterized protein n=1 Tax=Naematelia encephala TaxID=71784 RepID=A0A1Y2BAK4_9TREE|nr:hypothetical protein BCR39DRAFT_525347 [Naematelia encephala]